MNKDSKVFYSAKDTVKDLDLSRQSGSKKAAKLVMANTFLYNIQCIEGLTVEAVFADYVL